MAVPDETSPQEDELKKNGLGNRNNIYPFEGGRNMYKKILVAYDGSETSQAALDHAVEIADRYRSTLVLVHAVRERGPSSPRPKYTFSRESESEEQPDTPPVDYPVQEAGISKDKGAFLLDKARNNLYLPDSQIQLQVLYGEPAKEICEYAFHQDIDLIVIGNRGLHGVRKLMLGSVSQKVAQQADCPVLIVK